MITKKFLLMTQMKKLLIILINLMKKLQTKNRLNIETRINI